MSRGLEGRRVALAGVSDPEKGELAGAVAAIEGAGGQVQLLRETDMDDVWRGSRYAALIVVGGSADAQSNPRLVQLIREFLVGDKPVAVFGGGVRMLIEAGGVNGRTVAAGPDFATAVRNGGGTVVPGPIAIDEALITASSGGDVGEFTKTVARHFAELLEEHQVDETVDLSFPASDPPATTPSRVGGAAPEGSPRRD